VDNFRSQLVVVRVAVVGSPVGLMDGWSGQRPLSPTYAVVQHLLHDKWCAPPSQSAPAEWE